MIELYRKEVDLKNYHPTTVKDSYEFIKLADAENPEFKLLYDAFNNIFTNRFISDALEYGIAQWEQILDLYPVEGDTLENRRLAIQLALMSSLPYTYRKLEEILTNICGQGQYQIDLKPNDFTIKIGVSLGSKRQRSIVENTMEDVLPKNLIFTVDLLYNRHIDMEPFTHEFLEKFTHDEIVEEVLE